MKRSLNEVAAVAEPPAKRGDPAKAPVNADFELSSKQKLVMQMAVAGQSFFFTGEAGTGKSYVLKLMATELTKLHGEEAVYITASTGIAACAIGGVTLHSYAGLGLAEEPVPTLVDKLLKRKTRPLRSAYDRWRATKVLVIEECSMVSPEFFNKLSLIACTVRCDHARPFGGMQVVMCGDFFQLPPVCKMARGVGEPEMIFETQAWRQLIGDRVVVMDEIFRQREPALISLLADLRRGALTDVSKHTLEVRRRITEVGGIPENTVRLYATRAQADAVNSNNLGHLLGEHQVFCAVDKGDERTLARLADHWMAPKELKLKVGALVMLIFNQDVKEGLVNGATGTVVGLSPVQVKFDTYDGRQVIAKIENRLWEIKSGGVTIAARTQMPLILAWAITIHKCQGMSIARVEVNLDRIFERGQTYVAFSRAMSLAGLYVRGRLPGPALLAPNEKVVEWWGSLAPK